MSSTCPINGCENEKRSGIVMCRAHWYRVPKALRAEVWDAWRERLRALEGRNGPYDAAADRHEHAKAAAIAAVEARS